MVLEVTAGSFLKPSTGAPFTQTITGLGFQPKAIIFWTSNLGTADTFTPDAYFGFGFADGDGNEQCIATFTDDNSPEVDAGLARRTDAIMACITGGATAWRASVTNIGADGFTMTYHENDGGTAYISYIALGGTNVEGAIVGETALNTSDGNQTISGLGFQPNFVMMFTSNNETNDDTDAHALWGFGCARSSTARWAITTFSDNASDPSQTVRQQFTDRCLARVNTGASSLEMEADFVSFGATSFVIDLVNAPGGPDIMSYLAIRFNVASDVLVGSFNSATTTGNQTVTATTINSNKAVLLASYGAATSASIQSHNRLSMGAASASEAGSVVDTQTTAWYGDKDNESDTITVRYASQSDSLVIAVEDETAGDTLISARGDVTQFGVNNYTINWAVKDGTAYEILHIVFAAEAGGGGGGGGGTTPVALTSFVHMGEGGYY